MRKNIHVLVIDDSALVRQILKEVLESDSDIQVMGAAANPYDAAEIIRHDVPDVITLDIEMPRMDGVTFLGKIMSQHPIPVVICSSLATEGSELAIKAMEYGAVDIITKPKIGVKDFLEESKIQLIDSVKAASAARLKKINVKKNNMAPAKKIMADAMVPEVSINKVMKTTEKIIVLGASTGGTEAIRVFLEEMPLDAPGIVIVQHMPENFTAAFAKRLNNLCAIEVKEAEDHDRILRGRALIAPGNRHTLIKRSGARYLVEVKNGPLVCRHRPSVDVLFRSAAQNSGANTVGIIMTGMGDDGARGMLDMKKSGAWTIAQDRDSCVVFGMPQEAIKLGAVDDVLPLNRIAKKSLLAAE